MIKLGRIFSDYLRKLTVYVSVFALTIFSVSFIFTAAASAIVASTATETVTATPTASSTASATETGTASATATVTQAAGVSPGIVGLGAAGNFTILAESLISNTATTITAIVGDVGMSPNPASSISGFTLNPASTNGSNTFSTSPFVTGYVYASDQTVPTPNNLTTAVNNMLTAYNDAAGRPVSAANTNIGGGTLSGLTFVTGVYRWGSNVSITTDIYLSGTASDVFIFQISGTLTLQSAVKVHLTNGALASNVFWQVAMDTTLITDSDFSGTILDKTQIVIQTRASLHGRALAQTAVTLDANQVSAAAAAPAGTATATTTATPTVTVTATTTGTSIFTTTVTPTPDDMHGLKASNAPKSGESFVFPDPVRGSLAQFAVYMDEPGTAQVLIYNERADRVITEEDRGSGQVGVQVVSINVSALAPGVYFYKVRIKYDSGREQSIKPGKFIIIR